MPKLYEIFSGEELLIAEKIQQRRYQMLVHSYIYYELDNNLISDSVWSGWAVELANLQSKYQDIAKQVVYADDFEDWDGSSGAFLDFDNKPNIITLAYRLLHKQSPAKIIPAPQKPVPIKKTKHTGRKLF